MDLNNDSEIIALLDKYSRFLENNGYMDTDWREESNYPITDFLKTLIPLGKGPLPDDIPEPGSVSYWTDPSDGWIYIGTFAEGGYVWDRRVRPHYRCEERLVGGRWVNVVDLFQEG